MLLITIDLLPGGRASRRRTIASINLGNQSDLADISGEARGPHRQN
jgi:hypothetical protein